MSQKNRKVGNDAFQKNHYAGHRGCLRSFPKYSFQSLQWPRFCSPEHPESCFTKSKGPGIRVPRGKSLRFSPVCREYRPAHPLSPRPAPFRHPVPFFFYRYDQPGRLCAENLWNFTGGAGKKATSPSFCSGADCRDRRNRAFWSRLCKHALSSGHSDGSDGQFGWNNHLADWVRLCDYGKHCRNYGSHPASCEGRCPADRIRRGL